MKKLLPFLMLLSLQAHADDEALRQIFNCDGSFFRYIAQPGKAIPGLPVTVENGRAALRMQPIRDQAREMEEDVSGASEGLTSLLRHSAIEEPVALTPQWALRNYVEEHYHFTNSPTDVNGVSEAYEWSFRLLGQRDMTLKQFIAQRPDLKFQCGKEKDGICLQFKQWDKGAWKTTRPAKMYRDVPRLVLSVSKSDPKYFKVKCSLMVEGERLPSQLIKDLQPDWALNF
ncbi:hypothetical protein JOS77_25485 [Chromobacterium haemolyticum]|uniref:hypothetical protein n=1 Tax=Chromobacterium haemolyticum TaxID=394935 RepID=UPI00193BC045|nr:hypothetical protein JOS77_25485 [Chromobacterium haemolyticum]